MKILWFTWKDQKNPLAGGAEIVSETLAKRLVKNGHEVIFLVAGFSDSLPEESIDGYTIIRLGNKWTVYWEAYNYYKKNLIGWADLVIDEVNTIPFFTKFYTKEKNILFVCQLCREIWFYEIFFPFNIIGFILESLYLRLLKDRKVITISESTKKDLLRFGFQESNINIISMGTDIGFVKDLEIIEKFPHPTILSLGSMRKMKRTIDIVKAFKLAKEKITDLKLIVAGDGNSRYGKKVLRFINKYKFKEDISYLGKITSDKKRELMQKTHAIVVTSVKEGWGLIVTEANSQGTPAIVYNVDGLKDSVKNEETGLVCEKNNPENLSKKIQELLENKTEYERLCQRAWQLSKETNFDRSYEQFMDIVNEKKL